MRLPLLSSKRTIGKSGLLRGMTDVHSHLLPGVDDGVQDEAEAYQILTYLRDCGVSRMYLTPHIMSDYSSNTREYLTTVFETFRSSCPNGIELRLSGEYMLDSGFEKHRESGLLTMAHNHVLVETSYLSSPPGFLNMLYDLSLDGYMPILAHPERYVYMSEEDYYQLKSKGYAFQLNLMSLYGIYGRRAVSVSHQLLKEGYYDYVGSDLHRLDVYQETIEHLLLNRTEEKNLKRLLENNLSLW